MTTDEIKSITDAAKPAYCLVGARFFDKRLQQNVCLDTSHRCECKEIFENAIREHEEAKHLFCRACGAMHEEECACSENQED